MQRWNCQVDVWGASSFLVLTQHVTSTCFLSATKVLSIVFCKMPVAVPGWIALAKSPLVPKAEWRKRERGVPFSVSLTLPDSPLWYYPRPNWSYLPSAQPISAKATCWASSCLLQSLTGKREAHRDSGHPPKQGKKLPNISVPVTLL